MSHKEGVMRLIAVLILPFSILIGTPCHAADEDELLKAAEKSNLARVQQLLERGADVNAKLPSGITPLYVASQNGHAAVVAALLAEGADVKLKDSKGNTPLDYAQQKGHHEIVRMLTAPKPKKQ